MKQSQMADVETAVNLYYQTLELDSNDIKLLFGISGSAGISKKKKEARTLMEKKGVKPWNASKVNTVVAFEAWGIDIPELEKRLKRYKMLCKDT